MCCQKRGNYREGSCILGDRVCFCANSPRASEGGCPWWAGHQDVCQLRSPHFHQVASFSAKSCQFLRRRQVLVFLEATKMICLTFRWKNKKSREERRRKFLARVWFFMILWTVAHQAPLSMGFPRQEYKSELPCSPPGDFPDLGISYVSCIGKWVFFFFFFNH